jgi:hypothetical protein
MRARSDYNKRAAAPDGLQPRCRSCSAAWYIANKVAHKANVFARNQRVRAQYKKRLADYLLEHPCVDCGEGDICVLDFDHEDPTQKVEEVSRLAGFGIAWERVEAEIAKCSVRCANCHRRRTAEMFGYWRAGVERDRRAASAARARARLESLCLPRR